MDIPKKDSCKKIVFVALLILASGLNVLAEESSPAQILIDSYELPDQITLDAAEKSISELKHAIVLCPDSNLRFKIEYRIGILYFKAGELAKSVGCFSTIAPTADCPDLIKLCSYNMAAQIYRMQAEDDKSLGAFETLIELSKKILTEDPNQETFAFIEKLAMAAGFAKAEIYQYSQEYNSAIAEYKRIIVGFGSNKVPDANGYSPVALDRLSQLYLIKSKVEDYNQTVGRLIEKHPNYYRAGIIKLETEVVRILKQKDSSVIFPRGSVDATVRLIALFKDSGDKELKEKVILLLKDLYSQYANSYSGVVLGYHYAWLLDASGEKKEAVKVLEAVCSQAGLIKSYQPGIAQAVSTLADYAKLQQAVIFGEENNYRQALELIDSLKPDPNDIHMLQLSDSIKNALQTLKREVPKDANDQ